MRSFFVRTLSPLTVSCFMLLSFLSPVDAEEKTPNLSVRVVALPSPSALTVTPTAVTLDGVDASQRLLVLGTADGRTFDYSRKAIYTSSKPSVVTVGADGLVTPHGDGTAEIRVECFGRTAVSIITVKNFTVEAPVSFRNQVVPIFTKLGCNAGGCHGKASRAERLQTLAARLRRRLRLRRPRQGSARPAHRAVVAGPQPAAAQGVPARSRTAAASG